jgi:hypothetical protein
VQVELEPDVVTRHVGKLRSRLYLLVVASLVVAYLLGVMLKPSATYASNVQHAFNETSNTAEKLARTSWLAGFSYAWFNIVLPMLPSLVPAYGLLHNAMQWVYLGTATRSAPSQAGFILEDVALFTMLLSIPETDGLLIALLLIDYVRLRNQALQDALRRVTISYITWSLVIVVVLTLIVAMAY